MGITMGEGIERWIAKRRSAIVVEIIQGRTTVAEAGRAFDLTPSEIGGRVEDARKGMETAPRTSSPDVRQQCEKQRRELQEACGEAMLELRARKIGRPSWSGRTTIDPDAPRGPSRRRRRAAPDHPPSSIQR
ncbi:hypothetical protein LNKW23_45990 [Paralimibaculum aggregatum]|uniref:Transposase n=1 Tax=Paralimibaculum aggregatum TaxID=3036245 RepID=A0ABQ6LTI0_9RHOB|nr:transposase [Limibaculum sp. NKW23]GMG85379.1 hypothetical protein LNKW23_45990 [Limibaculum sp. NKW23]